MRKKILLFALSVIMLLTSVGTVLAANETDMSTTMTYTKEAVPEPSPPSPPSTYEVVIPASINLNAGRELFITSNYMNLADGDAVVVTIEAASFAPDGYVYLKSGSGDELCIVMNRRNKEHTGGELVYPGDTVARFNNGGTAPVEYGLLYLNTILSETLLARPGTYTGELYFRVSVIHD